MVHASSHVVSNGFWPLIGNDHRLLEGTYKYTFHTLSETWADVVNWCLSCDNVQRRHFVEVAICLAERIGKALVPSVDITIFIDGRREITHICVEM